MKCLLNDCEVDMLWDTGAQVSIIPVKSLQEHLGCIAIRPLSELLETSLNLTAVNGTQITYIGCVEVRLKLTPSSSNSTQVELVAPFLVTSENLDCPILGYNAIEELVRNDRNPIPTLYESFPGKDKAKLDALVNFIQSTSSHHICSLKTGRKDVVIPKNHTVSVDCRAKTRPVEKLTPVLFVTETLAEWPDGLEVIETLLNIKPGKTSRVKVAVYNGTDHDIVLKDCTMLGCLQAVKSLTAAEVRLTDKEAQGSNEKPEEEQFQKSPPIPPQQSEGGLNPLPAVDLSGLNQYQRTVAEAMLREEYESFAFSDEDIGCIPDLEMDINMKVHQPVQKKYTSVTRPLYPEVKQYIEDLLNQNFITKSKSPYSSPLVCVRKKDGTLKLCIDYREMNRQTIADRHPIPRVQETLDCLGENTWFTVLDQGKAYHQGFMTKESRAATAFL